MYKRKGGSYNSFLPNTPYLFVDDKKVGTLSASDSICLPLAEGVHQITMKAASFFVPTYTINSLNIEVKNGTTLYVRFGEELDGATATGSAAAPLVLNRKTTLDLVSADDWRNRK